MSGFQATREQKEASRSTEQRYTVRAAAGSGKTSVLVERYMVCVLELGYKPNQILTITFTRKAAAEMKRRIVRSLQDLDRFADAQVAETGPIQTIHSFCERTLRENALAAGIDPQFDVIGETQTGSLIERSVRWTLQGSLADYPEAQALVGWLAGKEAYDASPMLARSIKQVLSSLRGAGWTTEALQSMYGNVPATTQRWMEAFMNDLPSEVAKAVAQCDPEGLGESLVAAFKEAGLRKPSWLTARAIPFDEAAAEQTCGLMQLALLSWEWLESHMAEAQQFDFNMLEDLAVQLLKSDEMVKERLRKQYPVVLVDEAQDVNPQQFHLLSALSPELEMFVGDPQQSIFGFRQADRRLMIKRTEELPTLPLTINHRSDPGILRFVDAIFGSLWKGDYYPMSAGGLEDRAPAELFGADTPINYQGVEFWPQAGPDRFGTAKCIASLIEDGHRPGEIAVLIQQHATAAQISEELRRLGVPTRLLGASERFYTRLEVRDIANALDSLTNPRSDYALLALLRSPFVGLSLDSVVMLSAKRPVINSLKDFVPPIEEDTDKIARFLDWYLPLSEYADRIPAWEVLGKVMRQTEYMEVIARRHNAHQTLANIRKLMRLATESPELGPSEFADQIREIQELRHRESDAPALDQDSEAVTLMTIHQAKGVEFDVVVLPETHKRLRRRPQDIMIDASPGLVHAMFGRSESLVSRWLRDRLSSSAHAESLRVLYVAMTRAKKKLCIVVSRSPNEENIAGLICSRTRFNENVPMGVHVREVPSDS
ncbi:MAG: UvrD-helicase domain-containing protein [Armatimonadetes bacterium]|nr:UvrD-helicase domain-containing protein [Armatimonadota bacterium]